MKRESSWGLAGIVAIAATLGIVLQPWSQGTVSPAKSTANLSVATKEQAAKSADVSEACSGLSGLFANFLAIKGSVVGGPDYCYKSTTPGSLNSRISPKVPTKLTEMKFIVATVPDPVHSHLSLIFDRFTEVIQQAAQDEGYNFESSWMPWEDDKGSYALLTDQDAADHRSSERENQPGIILFRRDILDDKANTQRKGLAVFVVGEEPTAGIHPEQFRNASAWVDYLAGTDKNRTLPVAILGPSFSGSFSSLNELLSDPDIRNRFRLFQPHAALPEHRLAVYSGSANVGKIIKSFKKSQKDFLDFHSFLQDDETLIRAFIYYIEGTLTADRSSRFAILSEEDTAFGSSPFASQIVLSYPRDISSLRSAYQSKSIFGIASTQSQAETYGRNLPTDLADSVSKSHDTVHSYAGNQAPLSQEAYLLSIVNTLREYRTNYLILRGTNSLDMLFLANFFRRALPDVRIVVDSPDTLFQRERGTTSLSGIMTLATYPLFVQEQDWTGRPLILARRYFKSEFSEGVYIALRLLLNSESFHSDAKEERGCHVANENEAGSFLPPVVCPQMQTLPDYTSPLWLGSQCRSVHDASCTYLGPDIWLSVIGHNTFWPVATLTDPEPSMTYLPNETEWQRPKVPVSIKLALILVLLLSLFHCWCCNSASFTAKPAFLAHFATIEDSNHDLLIAIGCVSIAAMSLFIGWGSGISLGTSRPFDDRWPIAILVSAIWISTASAYLGSYWTNSRLSRGTKIRKTTESPETTESRKTTVGPVMRFVYFFLMPVAFLLAVAFWLESQLRPQNSFLTHWRAVHLGSGVSSLAPVLLIVAGIYVWFWFSLHGLALFGKERCLLPDTRDLLIKGMDGEDLTVLRVFSKEDNAVELEKLAKPLSREVGALAAFLAIFFFGASYFIEGAFPLRSLGTSGYSIVVDILVCACLGLMFAETWQLYRVWVKLHRLLTFLDYIPLRRTLAALHGFSWGRVWKMSGNVLDVRYKLLSRQLESRNHLETSLKEKIEIAEKELLAKCFASCDPMRRDDAFLKSAAQTEGDAIALTPELLRMQSLEEWRTVFSSMDTAERTSTISAVITAGEKYCVQLPEKENKSVVTDLRSSLATITARLREYIALTGAMNAIRILQTDSLSLATWYADNYNKRGAGDRSTSTGDQMNSAKSKYDAGDLGAFTRYQVNSAKAAGLILSRVLLPKWRTEGNSLVTVPPDHGKSDVDRNLASPSLAEDAYIRNAEEFVSFPFLGFVQNILGRLRTIVMGILALFIAITLAVSSYPFDPRHAISIMLVAVFVILGGVITYVYADMHRDSTLSHLTNTTPGELGSDFWFKILGFGIGPLIGLVATIFPEIGDFVISWLQPGINSVK